MKRINLVIIICCLWGDLSYSQIVEKAINQSDWKQHLNIEIPLMGHRNWILVVDKAFPLQNSNGIETIDTNADFFLVLRYALDQIGNSSHVKPIIYKDKELNFIREEQVLEIGNFRKSLYKVIGNSDVKELVHDSVFAKIDSTSKLFKVLVLKTNQIVPYSSVFIQLDCKHWSTENEKQLRVRMNR